MKKKLLLIPLVLGMLLCIASISSNAQCTNSGTALTATTTVSNINCNSTDGSITVNASGGWRNTAAPNGTGYTYAITAGPATRPSQSGNVFGAPLGTGTYTISITDCNGTTITRTATIGGTVPTAITATPTMFRSVCATDNGIKINASGGRAPYTYAVVSAPAGSTPFFRGDTLRGLAAGALSYTISDACGTTLGASFTVTTNFGLQPFINFGPPVTRLAQIACAGVALPTALPFNGGVSTGYQSYVFTSEYNFAPWDTVKVEVIYNGALVGTFYKTYQAGGARLLDASKNLINPSNPFNGNYFPLLTGTGFGTYQIVQTLDIKAGCTFTNTVNFTRTAGRGDYEVPDNQIIRRGCSDVDFTINPLNGFNGGRNAGPSTFFNGRVTKTIISGPAGTVGMVKNSVSYSPANSNINSANLDTFKLMPYGTYQIALIDECGNTDTVTRTYTATVFTASPDLANGCVAVQTMPLRSNPGKNNIDVIRGFAGLPKTAPVKYTMLSGPSFWTTYPFTVVDSIGYSALSLTGQTGFYIPNVRPGIYTIAAENACGQRDTVNFTISAVTDSVPRITSVTTSPRCGNLGDITINMAPGKRQCDNANTFWGGVANLNGFGLLSGPVGNTINSNIASSPGAASNTFINQPAGTYVFKCMAAARNATGFLATPYYSTITNALLSFQGGFIFQRDARIEPILSGAIDTAAFQVYDTTFTVVVPITSLVPSTNYAFLCKGSTTAKVLGSPGPNAAVPPITYQYSTVSNAGPWSTSQSNPLLEVPSAPAGTQVWLRVADNCGNVGITQTTTASLTATVTNNCSGGIATLTPNPYNANFLYEIVNRVTGAVVNSYTGTGTPITVDLNNPANAGAYTLRYKLAAEGAIGCAIDSIDFVLSSPCEFRLLPVKYTKPLTATASNCKIVLKWSVASTTTTGGNLLKQFVIQQSANGTSWQDVATVDALANTYNYTYTLNTTTDAVRYYRLKDIANNTSEVGYSSIVAVRKACNSNTSQLVIEGVYPVPFTGNNVVLSISSPTSGNATVSIYDAKGSLIQTSTPYLQSGINTISLTNINTSAKGVYIVKAYMPSTGHTASTKLIKQ